MNKPSDEDVYNALKTLKNKCHSMNNCIDCPLSIGHQCYFTYKPTTPTNWIIRKPGEYKAFSE